LTTWLLLTWFRFKKVSLDASAYLNVKPNNHNQAKGVRWAEDYVLGDKVKVAGAAG
jgi:hypothetical protein